MSTASSFRAEEKDDRHQQETGRDERRTSRGLCLSPATTAFFRLKPEVQLPDSLSANSRQETSPGDIANPDPSDVSFVKAEKGDTGEPFTSEGLSRRNATFCSACHFLRGSLAGSFAKTVVYPFDRLKMIYQVRSSVVGRFYLSSIYRGMRHIVQTEGALALWKGNLASFVRTFPHSGVVFYCYDKYYDYFESICWPNYQPVCRLLAGGCAGITSTFCTYPLDVWNTRMAVSYRANRYTQVTLLRYEGCISLFRGLLPTVVGMFPYAGISFYTFETLKYRILQSRRLALSQASSCMETTRQRSSSSSLPYSVYADGTSGGWSRNRVSSEGRDASQPENASPYVNSSSTSSSLLPSSFSVAPPCASLQPLLPYASPKVVLGPLESLLCGGTAGVVSQTATYPIDTVRKFMQANTFLYKFQEGGHVGSGAHVGILDSIGYIYRSGGIRAFYNGVSLNWIKGFVAAGISFAVNEWLKNCLNSYYADCKDRGRNRH